jgi:septal ring factor EnvC (AmiA/AmiB activator)
MVLSHRHKTAFTGLLKHARRGGLTMAVLLALLPYGALVAWSQSAGSLDDKIDSQKSKLKKIQTEIQAHRDKTKELKREETSVMKQLSRLDKEIELSKELVVQLDAREALLGQQIDSLRLNVSYEEQILAYQQKRLAARVRQMYMRGPRYDLQVILTSTNVVEASRRYKFLQMTAERDASLVREVRTRKSALENEQAVLTEAMADVVALTNARRQENEKLKDSKNARVSMLMEIRTEKSQHTEAIDELKRSEEQMKDLIGQLEQRRLADRDSGELPTGEFAELKGKLIRPVSGEITKKFGKDKHPKFGTVTFNNGVNIKAPAGAPIKAVATGRVEFVDWISGYGNCIILNHGEGYYTLYAHTAQIFVKTEQMVSRGDVIAEVGNSGSLNGYECHFEIRKSKQALDPIKWFAK